MATRQGNTIRFEQVCAVESSCSLGGKKESEGPCAGQFDLLNKDNYFGQKTWEQAESRMQQLVLQRAVQQAEGPPEVLFAGDLINQCISSAYAHSESGFPFCGLYGACSTMGEGLLMGAIALESGGAQRAAVVTSSHFCTAERQYRSPLHYGSQRAPTAQWTATAAGAVVLSKRGAGPRLVRGRIGQIVDFGITDMTNMGAAMAPAAYETLTGFFTDTGATPEEYDAIVTGDLGKEGSAILEELFDRDGVNLKTRHHDCGLWIYDLQKQDVHAGGSGCGCSASLFCAIVLPKLRSGEWKRVLFLPTGALMNTLSLQQGLSIPAIAHLSEWVGGEEKA